MKKTKKQGLSSEGKTTPVCVTKKDGERKAVADPE